MNWLVAFNALFIVLNLGVFMYGLSENQFLWWNGAGFAWRRGK